MSKGVLGVIKRLVENPLAQRLLAGEFTEGDTIRVDAQNGELVFERARAATAVSVRRRVRTRRAIQTRWRRPRQPGAIGTSCRPSS